MSFSRELGLIIEDRTEVAKLNKVIFEDLWNTSLIAKEPFWSKLLPCPAENSMKRIQRIVFPPIMLFDWLKERELLGF